MLVTRASIHQHKKILTSGTMGAFRSVNLFSLGHHTKVRLLSLGLQLVACMSPLFAWCHILCHSNLKRIFSVFRNRTLTESRNDAHGPIEYKFAC